MRLSCIFYTQELFIFNETKHCVYEHLKWLGGIRQSRRWKSWKPCISPYKLNYWKRTHEQFEKKQKTQLLFEKKIYLLHKEKEQFNFSDNVKKKPECHQLTEIQTIKDLSNVTIIEPKNAQSITHPIKCNKLKNNNELKLSSKEKSITSSLETIYARKQNKLNISNFFSGKNIASSIAGAIHLLKCYSIPSNSQNKIILNIKVKLNMAQESLRGTAKLPYNSGAPIRLVVFCPDDQAAEMIAAGADYAGESHIINRIATGFLGFEKCITTCDFMPKLMPLAKILGPKQLFPSPRSGTVVTSLKDAITNIKCGTMVWFRALGEGDISVPIGTFEMPADHLIENANVVCKEILLRRPAESVIQRSQNLPTLRNQSKKPYRRKILLHYFNTADPRGLYQPIRQRDNNNQKDNPFDIKSSSNELFLSGYLSVEPHFILHIIGSSLNPTNSGFTTQWPFQMVELKKESVLNDP